MCLPNSSPNTWTKLCMSRLSPVGSARFCPPSAERRARHASGSGSGLGGDGFSIRPMRLSKPIMFEDRTEAGRVLADKLAAYTGRADVVVLALPRGGVPVGFEVARSLGVPLDVCSVRKLGVPGHEELAMGAIAGHGTRVVNQAVVEQLGIPEPAIDTVAAAEQQELERRESAYRDQLPRPEVRGKTVLLVDDGLATGSTMRAAVAAIRQQEPARVVVAVPAGTESVCQELERDADQVICASTPEPLVAVGQAYRDFEQTTDEEVRDLLHAAGAAGAAGGEPPAAGPTGVGPGTGVGTASTGTTTAPADTGDLDGAPKHATDHQADAQAPRSRP
jgi:predicted phosphoribosyltransferase